MGISISANFNPISKPKWLDQSTARQHTTTPVAGPVKPATADVQIKLSAEGRSLSKGELPGWVNERVEFLRSNPDQHEAMAWVESMATGLGGGLIANGPNSDGVNDVYWAETGLPVTPASKARFAGISLHIQQTTSAMFYSQQAEGKSAVEIFSNLSQYMSTQPRDYLETVSWYRDTYRIN